MIIDRETFTELAVHLKLASDSILKTARHLAVLSNGDSQNEEHWAGTLDSPRLATPSGVSSKHSAAAGPRKSGSCRHPRCRTKTSSFSSDWPRI